jgi:aminoglycoside 6'-N-acetyltransferase
MACAESLLSARLTLRPVGEDDLVQLTAWWNDPTVRQVHGLGMEPLPVEAARQWLRQPDRALAWIARERVGGVPVGVIEMSTAADGPDGPVFELGIALDPAARGRGLGPEMIERLCVWAFEASGAASVVAEVRLENAVARRAFAACGFAPEDVLGHVVRMRRARPGAS